MPEEETEETKSKTEGARPAWVDEILTALKPKEQEPSQEPAPIPLPPEPEEYEDDLDEEPEEAPKAKQSFWNKIW